MPQGVAILVGESVRADRDLLAAVSVEVTEQLGRPTRYALTYAVGPSDGDLSWLSDARLSPGSSLRLQVPSPQGEVCLVRGPVTGQQIHLVHGGSGSMVEVLGGDAGVTMDRETKTAAFTEGSDSDVVKQLLLGYGLVPDVEGSAGRHSVTGFPLVQRETDLQFVQRLALKRGAQFWIECDATTGVQTARWRRMDLGASPEHALVINQDPANLEALDLRFDVESPTSVAAHQLDPGTLAIVDGSVASTPQDLLGADGLAAITADTRSSRLTAPSTDGGDLTARAEGALIEADLFLRAEGETTAAALGGVLRAHTVVELKGAGSRHSGNYLVTDVRHTIDSTGHRMRFALARNAWGS